MTVPQLSMPITALETMNEGLNHRLLNNAQERVLLELAKAGDNAATEELVRCNEKLIQKIAIFYHRSLACGDMELVDLQQYGRMGLLQAINRFDMARPVRFSTYATYWIRAYIRRYGMGRGNQLSMSYEANEKLLRIKRADHRLEQKLERSANVKEIADETGLSEKVVNKYRGLKIVSLDDVVSSRSTSYQNSKHDLVELELRDVVQDEQSGPEQQAEQNILFTNALKMISDMPKSWRQVLERRLGLNGHKQMTANAIAIELHISKQRILQIEHKGLERLQKSMVQS